MHAPWQSDYFLARLNKPVIKISCFLHKYWQHSNKRTSVALFVQLTPFEENLQCSCTRGNISDSIFVSPCGGNIRIYYYKSVYQLRVSQERSLKTPLYLFQWVNCLIHLTLMSSLYNVLKLQKVFNWIMCTKHSFAQNTQSCSSSMCFFRSTFLANLVRQFLHW